MSQPSVMEHVATCSNVDSGCTRDYTSQFTETPTFKSREELINWAKKVGRSNGIYIVVSRSDSGKGKKKPSVTLACERSGKCDIRNIAEKPMTGKYGRRNTAGTKKCDCPFRLVGKKKVAAGDEWELIVFEGKHNHDAEDTTGKQGHSIQGRLSEEEKSLVKDLRKTGKQPKEIIKALKERDENNRSTPRTIYNECQRLKELKRLHYQSSKLQQLMSQAANYGFIEKHRTHPKLDTAGDSLFIHPASLELLIAFPTVLIMGHVQWWARPCWAMSAVYGVTSTNRHFLVALAITLTHRGRDRWEWALTSLRGVMNDYEITMPDIVILPLDIRILPPLDIWPDKIHLAYAEAINNVFPTAKVLLPTDTSSTLDVILRYTRVLSQLNGVEYGSFKKKLDVLIASPTEADFERHVRHLRTESDILREAIEYVIDNLLKPYKEMLVAAWTDKVMHFGNTNPKPRWSLKKWNASYFMKLYLLTDDDKIDVDQTVLDNFWEDLHGSVEEYKAEVKASLEKSLENEYNDQDGFPELKKLHGTISIHALILIRKETIVAYGIYNDYGEYCSCAIRSTHGLPCAHEIAKYTREGRPIPPECINSYWRKLDLKPFSKTAEPIVEGTTKRRKLGEEKNKNTDSVLPLPVESEHNSPNAGHSIAPSTQARQTDDEVYDIPSTKQLEFTDVCPPEMRPYILDVKDVPRDGHCGFRAIASFMGYSEDVGWVKVREDLTNELLLNSFHYGQLFGSGERVNELLDALAYWESVCLHKKHWMTMPDMGHIIASCYNIVLVHLSSAQCFTFFPLRTAPISISISSPIEIVVGFVEDHFVQVYLKKGHPMPPPIRALTRKNHHLATFWEGFHEQRLTEWTAQYLSRIEHFTSLQPEAVSQKNPNPVHLDLL